MSYSSILSVAWIRDKIFFSGEKSSSEVVLRVVPTASERQRKPLNLAFCIDRSGSMSQAASRGGASNRESSSISGTPLNPFSLADAQTPPMGKWPTQPSAPFLSAAVAPPLPVVPSTVFERSFFENRLSCVKKALRAVLSLLDERDVVSVTVYDSAVQTIVPPTRLSEHAKAEILARVDAVEPGSATALHAGWMQAAKMAASSAFEGAVSRVLLLTDGEANNGETRVDVICDDFHKVAAQGVGTSCFGVGDSFNEDLLESASVAGGGNYYFIGGDVDLEKIFLDEIGAASSVFGRNPKIHVLPVDGVEVDCLNDFRLDVDGGMLLPALLSGANTDVVLSISLPKTLSGKKILSWRVEWIGSDGRKHSVEQELSAPKSVSKKTFGKLSPDERVAELVAVLRAAREKRKAVQALDAGNIQAFQGALRSAANFAASVSGELSAKTLVETNTLLAMSSAGESDAFLRKAALYQSYNDSRGKRS